MRYSEGIAREPFSAEEKTGFEVVHTIMALYIDNAKFYVQLSSAGLAVSIVFVREVVGIAQGQPVPLDFWLVTSWISFLLAILFGALYQYLAVKFLERWAKFEGPILKPFEWLVQNLAAIYGLMLIAFFCGGVLLTAAATIRKLTP